MKKAIELYPDCQKEDSFWEPSSYQPILNEFGTILVQVDDRDYQGDSRILYKGDGDGYGFLQFGWGSCSGCDALQACSSYKSIDALIKSLNQGIKWFSTREEALKFFQTHDWKGDYSYGGNEQKEFIEQVIKTLGGHAARRTFLLADIDAALNTLKEFNSVSLENIDLIKHDGSMVEINAPMLKEWKFIGLSNKDFVENKWWEVWNEHQG